MYCGSKVRYFYWEIDSFYYSRHRAVVNIPTQTLIISPWLVLCKMIISQLELKPPVVQLAVLRALTLYAMRLGTKDSFFLLWIRCSSLCGKPWSVHKTTSYASKYVGGEGRGDWCLPTNSGYAFILLHICCTFTKTFPDWSLLQSPSPATFCLQITKKAP